MPAGKVLEVEIVTGEMHDGLHADGLNEQDAPDGRGEQEKLTDVVEPLIKLRLNVVVVEPPAVTVPEVGFNELEKSKDGVAPVTFKL